MDSIHELAAEVEKTAQKILDIWGDGLEVQTDWAGLYIKKHHQSFWIGEQHDYHVVVKLGKLHQGRHTDLQKAANDLEKMSLYFASDDFVNKRKQSISRLKRVQKALG